VGEHPDGGPVTVRDGRFGAYVNWGKVNATIPKGTAPDSVTLSHALELIAEREGKPAARPRGAAKPPAKGKAAPAKSPAETKPAESGGARAKAAAPKRPAAKRVATKSSKESLAAPKKPAAKKG
jgi:DNA topoisomerase-1